MGRHARNNTNSAAFTYAERQMAKHGSRTERLGRDSMKHFDACSLCLERARDPRSCSEGHIYCQECIVSTLLAQKQDIKRQQAVLDRMRRDEEDELASARAAARDRVLRDFEDAQRGVANTSTATKTGASVLSVAAVTVAGERGVKRKFELDPDEVERLAREEEEQALQQTAFEMAEARKAKLPNFWLPSLTPSAAPAALSKKVKLQTLCKAVSPAHPVSLKSLVAVHWEPDPSDQGAADGKACICPVCRKVLTNSIKMSIMRACGHAICNHCIETICLVDKACGKCNTPFATSEKKGKPYIQLQREGTGFAAGGVVEAKKFDLAFQA